MFILPTDETKQFAQELLSTFNTSLGEVALIPTTGGVFTVSILHASPADFSTRETLLWDRKQMGGFPGTYISPSHSSLYIYI